MHAYAINCHLDVAIAIILYAAKSQQYQADQLHEFMHTYVKTFSRAYSYIFLHSSKAHVQTFARCN